MAEGIIFDRESAKRISNAVRTVEGNVIDLKSNRSGRKSIPGNSKIKWAVVTAITDANNYTANIYADRNQENPSETGKAVYVWDLVDELSIDDWIPVQLSNIDDVDYECCQQLGLL